MADCTYCEGVLDLQNQIGTFDEVLAHGPGVLLAPSLGALIPGHMLAISSEHVTSIAALGAVRLGLLELWLSRLDSCVARTTGAATLFFEHGSGASGRAGGACIDHAHLHILPTLAGLGEPIARDLAAQPLSSLEELSGASNQNYALVGTGGRWRVSLNVDLPSQWIRRQVAIHLGRPDTYDWAVFRGDALLAATLAVGREARHCLETEGLG